MIIGAFPSNIFYYGVGFDGKHEPSYIPSNRDDEDAIRVH